MKRLFASIIIYAVLISALAGGVLAAGGAVETAAPIDITELANALLVLLAAVITTFVVPWIKAKRKNESDGNVELWTRIAVQAAEQYFGSGAGQEKKKYVMEYLASRNITVDDAVIEASVNELFGYAGGGTPYEEAQTEGEL